MKKFFALFILLILASSNILFAQFPPINGSQFPSVPNPNEIANDVSKHLENASETADNYMTGFSGDILFVKHPGVQEPNIIQGWKRPHDPFTGDRICIHPSVEHKDGDEIPCLETYLTTCYFDNGVAYPCTKSKHDHHYASFDGKPFCIHGQFEHPNVNDCDRPFMNHCTHPKFFEHTNRDCPEGIPAPCLHDQVPYNYEDPLGGTHPCIEVLKIERIEFDGKLIFLTDNYELTEYVIDGVSELLNQHVNFLDRPLFIFNREPLHGDPNDNNDPFWSHYDVINNSIQITAGLSGIKLRETVYHELGHAAVGTACLIIPTLGGPHALDTESDPALALTEGWADFIAMFLNHQIYNNYDGKSWESHTEMLTAIGYNDNNKIPKDKWKNYECMVAAVFVDLIDNIDAYCDDRVQVSFEDIYKTFLPSLETIAAGGLLHWDILDWGSAFYIMNKDQNKFDDAQLQTVFVQNVGERIPANTASEILTDIVQGSENTIDGFNQNGKGSNNSNNPVTEVINKGEQTSIEVFNGGQQVYSEGEKVVKQGYYQGKQDGQQVVDNGIKTGNEIVEGGKELGEQGLKQGQQIIDNGIQGGQQFGQDLNANGEFVALGGNALIKKPILKLIVDGYDDQHFDLKKHSSCINENQMDELPRNVVVGSDILLTDLDNGVDQIFYESKVQGTHTIFIYVPGIELSVCDFGFIGDHAHFQLEQNPLWKIFPNNTALVSGAVYFKISMDKETPNGGRAIVHMSGTGGYDKEFTFEKVCFQPENFKFDLKDYVGASINFDIQELHPGEITMGKIRLTHSPLCGGFDLNLTGNSPLFTFQQSIHFNENEMEKNIPVSAKDASSPLYSSSSEESLHLNLEYSISSSSGFQQSTSNRSFDNNLRITGVITGNSAGDPINSAPVIYIPNNGLPGNQNNSGGSMNVNIEVLASYNKMPLENVEIALGTNDEPEKFGKIISGKDGRAVFSNVPDNTDVIAKASTQGYIIDPLQFNSGVQSQTQYLNIKVMQMNFPVPNQSIKVIKPK